MRRKILDELIGNANSLPQQIQRLFSALDSFHDASGKGFDIRAQITGKDSSISQIIARIETITGITQEFSKGERIDIAPIGPLQSLNNNILSFTQDIDNFVSHLDTASKAHGALVAFDYATFIGTLKNGTAADLKPQFHRLFDGSERLLESFFDCLAILKPRAAYSFQAATNSLAELLEKYNVGIQDLKASQLKYADAQADFSSIKSAAENSAAALAKMKDGAESDKTAISTILAEVTNQKVSVDSIQTEAVGLRNTIEAYKIEFDKFQKLLDSRNTAWTSGEANLEKLLSTFRDHENTVSNLIEKSEQMLSSATVSGLASNFDSMKNKLTGELKWARSGFYIGIIFLTISALPLLFLILAPILAEMFPNAFPAASTGLSIGTMTGTSGNGLQYFAQVVGRLTFLLPAAWFVSFAAIRHSSLFRLREHYAYKYSMAVSVEGFKKQAPEYEQEIAALVLEQLAFNPTDRLVPSKDIREGKAPGITGLLLEKLRKRIEEGKPEKP